MEIYLKQKNNISVVFLTGIFDFKNVKDFHYFIDKNFSELPDMLYVDLSGVDYIDSLAIGNLIKLNSSFMRYNAKLYLANLNNKIKRLFTITNMDKFFDILEIPDYDKFLNQ